MIMVKKYGTAILIWMLLIPVAILNGGLREYVLIYLGVIARPLSGIILSACIFAVAFFLCTVDTGIATAAKIVGLLL